jgi:uncharacterized sulfatase
MSQHRRIVVIMTDTQRRDMIGCYGNKDMKTPNIDKLASEGIRFEKAYTCQPVCGPARSALFTGLYPHSNGCWGNSMPLGDNVKTIGQRMKDYGFHTAYIGKWHLDGGDYFGIGRCPEGWDEKYWYDMRCYLEEMSDEDRLWSRKPEIMKHRNVTEEFTYAHKCSNKAIDFLTNHNDEDFLLVVSYDEPHHPFVCPEPFSSMYEDYEFPKSPNVQDRLEGKPEHQKAWSGNKMYEDKEALKIKHPYFFGCNSYVDYEIGRVIKAIDEYSPDALVIYTSDHGDMLHSHSLNNKGAAMYEENVGIPLIVPTIMQAAGLPVPKLLEGNSMVEILLNPEIKVNDAVFIEFGRYEIDHDGFGGFQPIRAIFDGRYKLVINLLTSDELYDLENDPWENKNLISDQEYSSIRNMLHDRILDWMNNTRDPFRGYYWERRPWRTNARPADWNYTSMTRQREHEEYEPRQLDYETGLEIKEAVRKKN